MTAIRVILLCIAAAMVCATIRMQRPEIATAVSLAVGLGALLMTGSAFGEFSEGLKRFSALTIMDSEASAIVLKAAGITMISELGVQICTDAGESALAGRIRLATRIVLLGMVMPLALQVLEGVEGLFA